MRTAGLDIGSRTVKLAIVEDGRLAVARVRENSFDPLSVCRDILAGERFDGLCATGYGRHLFAESVGCAVITEIKAACLGARHLHPGCRTVLDIGGQDTKAISIDGKGGTGRFEMNDKCAAGTGRFIEIMAMALGCSLETFTDLAEKAAPRDGESRRTISNVCAVFAESEVVGLIARGESRATIAAAIVDAIAGRAASLVRCVGLAQPLVFIGGVARCRAIQGAIAARLGMPVSVPAETQCAVALGCALAAAG